MQTIDLFELMRDAVGRYERMRGELAASKSRHAILVAALAVAQLRGHASPLVEFAGSDSLWAGALALAEREMLQASGSKLELYVNAKPLTSATFHRAVTELSP